MGEWFETDSLQWCKRIDKMRFKFCQVIWIDTCKEDEKAKNREDEQDNHCVIAAFIDLWQEDESDVLMALRSFGYGTFEEVNQVYGDYTTQIMAECVFETYYWTNRYTISDVLSEKEAKKFAEDWMKEN